MEETMEGRTLPAELSCSSESPVPPVDENKAQKPSIKAEHSAISDVQISSDDVSLEQSQYISEGSGDTRIGLESATTSLSEVKVIESPRLDSLKMDPQNVYNQQENRTSSCSTHIENNNDVDVSSKIELVDVSHGKETKVETVESPLSRVKDKATPNQLDGNGIGVETVMGNSSNTASAGPDGEKTDKFDISNQVNPSDHTSQSLSSNEIGCNPIEGAASMEYPASANPTESNNALSPDGSSIEKRPMVDHITTSLKDMRKSDGLEISGKSENGSSVDKTNIQGNNEDDVSGEIGSYEDMSQSLPSDKLSSQVEDGTNFFASTTLSTKTAKANRGLVDTAAPFESVKEAVTKFGGIVDWKAHKSKTLEMQKYVQTELEIIEDEIPRYKKQAEASQQAKVQVLEELESTKRLIEELKLSLEKAQTEEEQAKQDSELAQLRVKEIEQGIASEASVAVKEQLNVAKMRHAAAVAELKSVKEGLKVTEEEYVSLISDRDFAVARAEEVTSASKDIEKTVEELTLELITAREALELAQASHMEAEEHRIGAALARDQDSLNWEKELKQAEDELLQLNEKILSAKDLQSKLDTASSRLLDLEGELAAYMEAKLNQESESMSDNNQNGHPAEGKETHASILAEVASTKKELEEVNAKIEKARKEVDILKVETVSLKDKMEVERAALATMRQREGMASIAVSSLEAELSRTKTEIEQVQKKEKEARERMVELPKALQEAAREADEAKSLARLAHEELKKAKEESEQAKASVSTMESKLHAALKEIEATRASEKLALAAINALQESEQASESAPDDSHNGVTLPLEEYYALSKRAHDVEEQAGERVAAAVSQIEVAKESEARSLENLELANKEMIEKKEALRLAMERAEKANEGKLAVEQELRTWRAENERRRKAVDASLVATTHPPRRSFEGDKGQVATTFDLAQSIAPNDAGPYTDQSNIDDGTPEVKTKKKKSFFPRIVMLLARKRATGT